MFPETQNVNGKIKDGKTNKPDTRKYRRKDTGDLNDFVQYFYNLAPTDLNDWQTARKQAKANKWLGDFIWPNKSKLIQLYEELEKDAHLKALVNNRLHKSLAESFDVFNADGTENVENTALLQRQWFQDFIRLTIEAKLFGYSLIELGDVNNETGEIEDVYNVQRRNVVPEYNVVRQMPYYVNEGIKIDELPYSNSTVLVDTGDLGIYEHCGPLVLSKRFAIGAWTSHAEIFGTPFLVGKTDVQDQAAVDNLSSELIQAGRERTAIIDTEEDFLLVDQNRSDTHGIYNELIARCNSEIAKLIVGQTLTTDEGGSYSQASVHKSTFEELAEADQQWVEDWVNRHLFPLLKMRGYPFTDGQYFKFNQARQRPLTERVQLLQSLLPYYEISPEEIARLVNVEVSEKEEIEPSKPEETGGKPAKPDLKKEE